MKIMLVEDHHIVREGLRRILASEADTILEADNGRTAVQLARAQKPDVVVMDISMPELNGIDATKRIIADNPKTRVIGLSMRTDRRYVLEMLGAGAAGYVTKSAAAADIVRAVRTVAAGQTYLDPQVSGAVVDALRAPPGERFQRKQLSTREREVLQLLAEGRSSKDIARALHVAVSTVETHRRQIAAKLGLKTVAELTKYAVREGLTSLE